MGKIIAAYITADEKRILGGHPLALLVEDERGQARLSAELGRALHADIVRLTNGDYLLLTEEGRGK